MKKQSKKTDAIPVAVHPLWKVATSPDMQKPLKLENAANFFPFEIEHSVVRDHMSKIYKSWISAIREYIANAESACISAIKLYPDCMPEINITYDPGPCILTIEDNGTGISRKMFMDVFRYYGRSSNALDPTISGMFGLGAKSFIMLVGDKGSMVIHTKSRETDECYKMYARKVGFDELPPEDRDYGTSFTFIHDPGINKYELIKAIYYYSQFARVPVNLRIIGNSVTVDNAGYNPYLNEPRKVTINPTGPIMISKISPESLLDKKVLDYIKQTTYLGHAREFIKVSYSTQHYDFYGLMDLDKTKKSLAILSIPKTSLILITMPTEDIRQELFPAAWVMIKSEAGPDWLPRPTPDRERFEEKSKEAFLDKLNADIVEKLQTITGESLLYSGSGSNIERNVFTGIGKILSYRSYFDMSDTQKIIWNYIFANPDMRKHLPPQTAQIVNQLCQEVNPWDTDLSFCNKYELRLAIETARHNNQHVYLAPPNARKSRTMREKANAAKKLGGVVLLDLSITSLPQSLLDELPVFRDLSEIKDYSKEKMPEQVRFHEVEIDRNKNKYRISTRYEQLESLRERARNKAVAFRKDDNINAYLSILEDTSQDCPVGLFMATLAQIKWLQDNTKILSLREYIPWAREQKLTTSRGPMKLDQLLGDSNTIFHSIGETAGSRLLKYFKSDPDIIYVPLTGEDYFMAAAAIQFSLPRADDSIQQANKSRIYSSSMLIEPLLLGEKDKDCLSDITAEREGLWIYSLLVLGESNDLRAIEGILDSAPLEDLAWIIDSLVKLRRSTKQRKSAKVKPESYGQVKGGD